MTDAVTTASVPVKWREPIEAVHTDGRVVPAEYMCWCNGDVAAVVIEGRHTTALPYGYVDRDWKIRNVAA